MTVTSISGDSELDLHVVILFKQNIVFWSINIHAMMNEVDQGDANPKVKSEEITFHSHLYTPNPNSDANNAIPEDIDPTVAFMDGTIAGMSIEALEGILMQLNIQ